MIAAPYRGWVEAICRAPGRALLLLLLACVPATYLSVRYFMNVHAELQELLPADSPSVKALDELHRRIGGVSNLIVIAESADAESNRRFIAELGGRLKARQIPEAKAIRDNVDAERRWIENRAALLLPADRFDQIIGEVEVAIEDLKKKANPLIVELDEEDAPPPPSWDQLQADLEGEAKKNDRFPHGFFETSDGTMVVLLIALRGSEVDIVPAQRLTDAVREEIGAIRSKYPAGLKVAFSGEVENLIEEHDAILADVSLSTAMVLVLVGLLIAIYFRSTRAIFTVLFSLTPGLLFSFALGRLSGSVLNSNSAFLGSIIAGNGINYPLVLLAYYRLRPESESVPDAIFVAARQALPGTLAAAVTASAAYVGLATATFRGFSDFGLLGGIGMLTVWVMTFLTAPLAIALSRPPRMGASAATEQQLERYFSPKGPARAVAVAAILLTIAGGAIGATRALHGGLYDMNLLNLRSTESLKSGSASWDRRVSALFGVWLNPVIGMAENRDDREALAESLRAALVDGPETLAERVETIEKFVPPESDQLARIARLKKVKESIDRLDREKIPEKARPYVDRWMAPQNLTLIRPEEVPSVLTLGFSEMDGRVDRTVLVFPSLAIDFNDGNNILRFVARMATAQMPERTTVAGSFLFMAAIIDLVRSEAPRVVATVAFLVAAVLIPIFFRRPLRVPLIVVTVALVALAAQAMMFAVGVRLNMLNFAAVPITIGVGSDYIVNLLGAMDAYQVSARRACIKMGGAILLCSLTTMVGYFSLLLAHSGALRSFGWAAVLGELMATGVVLLVLPVLLGERGASV